MNKMDTPKTNRFGRTWEKLTQPVEAIVGAIDIDGYNIEMCRVGLSAIQTMNLGIEIKSAPLNVTDLQRVVRANEKGLLDSQNYGDVVVEFEGHKKSAQVYNAFGPKCMKGCEVRVSSTLAEDLGLKLEDKVKLYTK